MFDVSKLDVHTAALLQDEMKKINPSVSDDLSVLFNMAINMMYGKFKRELESGFYENQ